MDIVKNLYTLGVLQLLHSDLSMQIKSRTLCNEIDRKLVESRRYFL